MKTPEEWVIAQQIWNNTLNPDEWIELKASDLVDLVRKIQEDAIGNDDSRTKKASE